ncbi:glycosyltransferase family 4 protein [Gemmatimonas sp.]
MTRPLRVVATIRQFAPAVGGAQTLLVDVLAALRARGHETSVVTFDSASVPDLRGRGLGLPPREFIDGVMVHRVAPDGGWPGRMLTGAVRHPLSGRLAQRLTGIDLKYWGDRPSVLGMTRVLFDVPADLILTVGWYSRHVPLTHAMARLRGIPVIGIPCFHLAQRSAYWPRHRSLARAASALVALSEPEATHAQSLGARRVHTIAPALPPSWADAADGARWRAEHAIPADVPLVGFVGRQVAKKGCVSLISAMRAVWQSHPHARLLLAGRIRNRDEATTNTLAALAPNERSRVIEIDDFSDTEAPSIMAACTMLALPSADEAFGIVYIEAWACGRPIIAADIPSSRWLTDDGAGAILVPPDDVGAIASAVRSLLDDSHMADRLGQYGLHLVHTRFARTAFNDGWTQLVESVCTRPTLSAARSG